MNELEDKSIEITDSKQHKEIYTGKGGGNKKEKPQGIMDSNERSNICVTGQNLYLFSMFNRKFLKAFLKETQFHTALYSSDHRC